MAEYTLNVNGKSMSVDVAADTPLLWVLRDNLNLTGTKYGCGIGQCGACTVHMRGRAVRSCQTTVATAANAAITTIEGLSPDGTHPLQRAWKELDVPECGYCQAGQIMAAAALLAVSPQPSDTEIDAAMNTNLCRCGTYLRIRQGIHRAVGLAATGAGKGGGRESDASVTVAGSERARASEPTERSGAYGVPASDVVGGRAGAKPPALNGGAR